MDEQPNEQSSEQSNVNNLNGVPNFGHGMPEVPEGEMVMPDAASPEGAEVMEPEMPQMPQEVTESPADESEVEPMPEMAESDLPEDN